MAERERGPCLGGRCDWLRVRRQETSVWLHLYSGKRSHLTQNGLSADPSAVRVLDTLRLDLQTGALAFGAKVAASRLLLVVVSQASPGQDGRLWLHVCRVPLHRRAPRKTHRQERSSSVSGPRTVETGDERGQQKLPVRPRGLSGQRGVQNIRSAEPRGEQGQAEVRPSVLGSTSWICARQRASGLNARALRCVPPFKDIKL